MDSIGQQFIKRTKHGNFGPSDQSSGKPQLPIQLEFDKTQPVVKLPKPSEILTEFVDVRKTIEQRKSIRNYSKVPLTTDQLSYLLWCTQGVKDVFQGTATYETSLRQGLAMRLKLICSSIM